MTTQEKIEAVRQKCIEANPAIMELGFGCEVKVINENWRLGDRYWHGSVITPCAGIGRWYIITKSEDTKKNGLIKAFNLADRKNTVILGRPIGLGDVLLAIGDQGLVSMSVHTAGDFGTVSFIWEPIGAMKHMTWNLLKDSLVDQSPETIDFLHHLLKA